MVISDQVKRVEQLLNNRPVRKFKYKTPNQELLENNYTYYFNLVFNSVI